MALLWRYVSHTVMLGLCLLNEARPAPSLPDAVLAVVPRIDWIARHNYHLWVLAYIPVAAWLWRRDRRNFLAFLYIGGAVSLLRGVTVNLTGLGPVDGPDVNAGAPLETLWAAWLGLVNPFSALTTDVAHVSLTKDLFFSGHVSSTFLLALHCRRQPLLGPVAWVAHGLTVLVVIFSHLHYTVDVVGAWAIVMAIHLAWERRSALPAVK